jgi:hypothetical protein
MNRMNRIVVAGLAILLLAGVASAQSLGELARQERERKSGGAAPKVITSEMIEGRAGEPPGKTMQLATGGAPANAKPANANPPANAAGSIEKKDDKEPKLHSEAWWRNAFKEARENLSRAEGMVRVLEIQLAEANKALLIRDDVFNKEGQLIPQINALTTELDAARRLADVARQKIESLEDELRRTGGLPGWAR